MNTERMSVHKALSELKTLDDRIEKNIEGSCFVVANKHSNQKFMGMPIDELKEHMKSNYQKVTDLITRRNAIKRAVVLSNAITKVIIGGVEYTVAEAIEMKNHGIEHYALFLGHIKREYASAKREIETNNGDKLEAKADTYITTLYGNSDMKNLSEEVQSTRKDFIASQTYELIDSIGVESVIEELEKTIDEFIVDVDSALSVSNALTEIEISY
jgi:hypothetical protein